MGRRGRYLAVHTHPATVQGVLTQAGRTAQLVLPRCGVDDLDGRVAHRPVDAKVGRLPRLPRFRVADAWSGETRVRDQEPVARPEVCAAQAHSPLPSATCCHPGAALTVLRRWVGPADTRACRTSQHLSVPSGSIAPSAGARAPSGAESVPKVVRVGAALTLTPRAPHTPGVGHGQATPLHTCTRGARKQTSAAQIRFLTTRTWSRQRTEPRLGRRDFQRTLR